MARPRLTPEQKAARARSNEEAREAGHPTAVDELNAAFKDPGTVRSEKLITKARETVIVACKVGLAYIDLRLFRQERVQENTQTGPREITEYRATGNQVRIRGTAYPRGTPPAGFPSPPIMADGAALTPNVDKDFFDTWLEQNKLSPLVTNRLIFAHKNIADVRAEAKEVRDIRSGLEPLNPDKSGRDPRMPRSTNASITNVETEDERAAKQRQTQEFNDSFIDSEI
jgi:hypothetical protein